MHRHSQTHKQDVSRRDFFQFLAGGTLTGASILELAFHRAAWARAQTPGNDTQLFNIEQAAEGVYLAKARAQAEINCNAAIFVNSADVLVVDAHSKPSAAAALIAQIRKQITSKPVRYVVNSHFHWDHSQGDHAYRVAESKIDFIASEPTKQLLPDLAQKRLKESLDQVPGQIDSLRARAAKSTSEADKVFCEQQIRQLRAYQDEMRNYAPELPTITFRHFLRPQGQSPRSSHRVSWPRPRRRRCSRVLPAETRGRHRRHDSRISTVHRRRLS